MFLLFRNYFLFLLSCAFIASCTKRISEGTSRSNVYIAGSNGNNPVLWKNNVAQILSDSTGSANQVIVSGNDVYVAGQTDVSGNDLPSGPFGLFVYWKNGVQNNIGSEVLFGPTGPGSVAILGEDVYYANTEPWENGKQITLQEQGWAGRILSTFTSNNDIYFAGTDSLSNVAYWKNGVLNAISQTTQGVFCIYVSGDDVYLGGDDSLGEAILWKNAVADYLKSSISGASVTSVHSIFVS